MTATPSLAVRLFGTDEPPAESRTLTAGTLSVELDGGNLRYIRIAGREAIRAVSYIVRDKVWGTYASALTDLDVREEPDGFRVTYTATCKGGGQSFTYRAEIVGSADRLSFTATGAGDTDFLTNRTGFVVLHGVEGIAGERVTVEHVDGTREETEFPALIDPKQPILDIRALTHRVAPGLTVRCEMTGDAYEMEDQRNWTDASYKTYVRPLSLPHPYTLPAGEAFTQAVTLTFEGTPPPAAAAGEAVTVRVGAAAGRVPSIGMALEAAHASGAAERSDALSRLRPAYLSCFLDMREPGADAAMAGFGAVGRIVGAPLALEVVVPGDDPEAELAETARLARAAGVEFAEVAAAPAGDLGFVIPGTVFPDSSAFDRLFAAARAAFPDARIGGGNFVYFTELNRKPVPTPALDYVLHGTCALVHAADDRSVAETIECLPSVFRSVRAQYGDMPYRVSPAGIGTRTSPFGGSPPANPDARRMTMTRADPRQRGLLGAAWHLGYAARAAAAGVDSLTLAAPVGEFGLIHAPMDFAQPWFDAAGGVYPAYHVMRALYAASGAPCREVAVSAPGAVQALAVDLPGGPVLWIANLTGDPQEVRVEGFDPSRIARIDADSVERLAADPDALDRAAAPLAAAAVRLGPYATARLS